MIRLFLLMLLISAVPTAAQRKLSLEKQLQIFWKSKHVRAQAIARNVSFVSGDSVADIGTGDGWFAAVLSMYTDSVTYFLEDIDSAGWSRPRFDSALNSFASIGQKKISNHFRYVRGTETTTGLPLNAFHKVLIIDTYHHFTHRDEMLTNVASLLKAGGKLVILEAIARRPGDIHQGCRKPIYSEDAIVRHLESRNLKLESVRLIHKLARRKNKLFIFVKE